MNGFNSQGLLDGAGRGKQNSRAGALCQCEQYPLSWPLAQGHFHSEWWQYHQSLLGWSYIFCGCSGSSLLFGRIDVSLICLGYITYYTTEFTTWEHNVSQASHKHTFHYSSCPATEEVKCHPKYSTLTQVGSAFVCRWTWLRGSWSSLGWEFQPNWVAVFIRQSFTEDLGSIYRYYLNDAW